MATATAAEIASRVSDALTAWAAGGTGPGVTVYSGRVILQPMQAPGRLTGVDVACLGPTSPAVVLVAEDGTTIHGVPTLGVLIARPLHRVGELSTAIRQMLGAGVPLVWVIDPDFRTVTAHRPGQPPVMLNDTHEMDGGDVLPGFRVPVARLFPG